MRFNKFEFLLLGHQCPAFLFLSLWHSLQQVYASESWGHLPMETGWYVCCHWMTFEQQQIMQSILLEPVKSRNIVARISLVWETMTPLSEKKQHFSGKIFPFIFTFHPVYTTSENLVAYSQTSHSTSVSLWLQLYTLFTILPGEIH